MLENGFDNEKYLKEQTEAIPKKVEGNKLKRLSLFFIGIIILCYSCNNKKDNTLVEEKIKAIVIDMWDAIEHEDIERYASHIHPDYTSFGETEISLSMAKETEIKMVKDWTLTAKDIHTEMSSPRVSVNGDIAWITYIWSDSGIENGKIFSSKGKSSRIFINENNEWLCIHSHFTLLPEE